MELHVRADLDDGVRYRVGLVLVALRLVVVEAVVVLHCRDDEARGQKGDQEGQCVPGREAHVWPSARDGSGTPVCPSVRPKFRAVSHFLQQLRVALIF